MLLFGAGLNTGGLGGCSPAFALLANFFLPLFANVVYIKPFYLDLSGTARGSLKVVVF